MGNVSDSRKQILLNTLDDEISQYFDVSPPTNVGKGELPVVNDLFQLQIVEEDGDTQLSLRWTSGNERKVETDYCEGCKTKILNDKVKGLVEKLVKGKRVEFVVQKKEKGVLYKRIENDEWRWFWEGDDKNEPTYVGEIEKGKPHGIGTLTYKDGSKYEGGWKNGVVHGQGISNMSFGYRYEGEYKNGFRDGQGTLTYPDGRKYVGGWKDGRYHGQGTRTNSDGSMFIGEYNHYRKWNGTEYDKFGNIRYKFVNGKQIKTVEDVIGNGLETLTFVDGKYVGELKDGILHGQGTYTWSNGDKYVGEWKNGKMTGQGTFTYHNGTKYEGEWKDNKKWTGKKYDKNGNIQVMIVNGKEIKPVEEETLDERIDRALEEYNANLKKKYSDDKNPCDSGGEKSNRKYSGWERDPVFRRDYMCNDSREEKNNRKYSGWERDPAFRRD